MWKVLLTTVSGLCCILQADLLSRHVVKFQEIVRDLEMPPRVAAAAAQQQQAVY